MNQTQRILPRSRTTLKQALQVNPKVSTTKPLVLDDYLASVPPESNSYVRQKEKLEYDHTKQLPSDVQSLLPTLDDPNFNTKLVQHPEFHFPVALDANGAALPVTAPVKSVEQESNKLCSETSLQDDDQFLPHQLFVRNFLSLASPYNSLLLYHGATANRWSAVVGIAEAFRNNSGGDSNDARKIVIVTADPESFRRTLFEPTRMLELIGDRVMAKSGIATEGFLREVNPMNDALPMDQVIQHIQHVIQTNYTIVSSLTASAEETDGSLLLVIDNVHPVPSSAIPSGKNKKLVLLYSFPMLKKPQEIIDVVNVMNANDHRGLIDVAEVFDPATGKFVEARTENGHYVQEGGYDLLHRKLNGYVSYVRTENPYTHALRIYPDVFAPERVFRESTSLVQAVTNIFQSFTQKVEKPMDYPTLQINGKPFTDKEPRMRHLPVYLTAVGEAQDAAYHTLKQRTGSGASLLPLLDALTMTYPTRPSMEPSSMGNEEGQEKDSNSFQTFLMESSNKTTRYEYRYPEYRIFRPDQLPKYSGKLAEICKLVQEISSSKVLIVSSFLDTGLVPLAMALEEYGLALPSSRESVLPLISSNSPTTQRTYSMITTTTETDSALIMTKTATADIILFHDDAAQTPSSLLVGLKFPTIRQIHFVDPPQYLNRIEEWMATVSYPGSHCGLPFAQRNVEIYMHASASLSSADEELADVYAYRILSNTATSIGKVTRLLKEVAVDCLFAPRDYSMDSLATVDANKDLDLELSNKKKIAFQAGDHPYNALCDYMQSSTLAAWASAPRRATHKLSTSSSSAEPITALSARIRQLFQEKVVYPRTELLVAIQQPRLFPIETILTELSRLRTTKSPVLFDKYGRRGYLSQHSSNGTIQYAFQPVEISDTTIRVSERRVPVENKPMVVQESHGHKKSRGLQREPVLQESQPTLRTGGKLKTSTYGKLVEQIQLCVDIATGDSDVQRSSWCSTVRAWFNELQLVHHISANEVRNIVVEHVLDEMPVENQQLILTHMYDKVYHAEDVKHPTKRRIRAVLNRRFHNDDGLLLGNHVWKSHKENGMSPRKSWKNPILDSVARWKQASSKQDLISILETSVLGQDDDDAQHFRKRKITSKQVRVLAEVLLRAHATS